MTVLDDVRMLREELSAVAEIVDANKDALSKHEEQINGQRGLSAAIDSLSAEIKGLRTAAYWVAGVIIAGSITFAFTTMTLIG